MVRNGGPYATLSLDHSPKREDYSENGDNQRSQARAHTLHRIADGIRERRQNPCHPSDRKPEAGEVEQSFFAVVPCYGRCPFVFTRQL